MTEIDAAWVLVIFAVGTLRLSTAMRSYFVVPKALSHRRHVSGHLWLPDTRHPHLA